MLQHLDEVAPDAALMGAVNTVRREGDRLIGENTDGKGFLRSVREDAGIDPRASASSSWAQAGRRGRWPWSSRWPARRRSPSSTGRPSAATELVRLLNEKTPATVHYVPWMDEYRVPEGTDILVNATSIGLYPNVDEVPAVDMQTICPRLLVCDVIPNPPNTRFLQAAEAAGRPVLNGLGMLVYQGAIAFKLWSGVEPDPSIMRAALETFFAG